MQELGLISIVKKKFRITTNSEHKFTIAKNHLNREFITDTPNQVWVSDITYLRSKEGWPYLTTVIDLYNRKVIGWSLSSRMYATQTVLSVYYFEFKS